MGQLGLGEDVMERERPALVKIPDPVIQVYGGGMHTVCLTEKGEVLYVFLHTLLRGQDKLGKYRINRINTFSAIFCKGDNFSVTFLS